MTRFSRLVLFAAVATLGVGTAALAQAPKAVPAQPRRVIVGQPIVIPAQGGPGVYRINQGGFYQVGGSGIPALPGYYQLTRPNVQKELELVPEQIDKLKEIGKEYYAKYTEQTKANRDIWKDWRKMTPEQRAAKSAETREQYKKLAAETTAEVEKVLLPHQIKRLKEIEFNTRAPYALQSSYTLSQLGVSDQQKEKLKQIRDKLTEQYQEMQKKALEDALKVLTPEQVTKLKNQIQKRGY